MVFGRRAVKLYGIIGEFGEFVEPVRRLIRVRDECDITRQLDGAAVAAFPERNEFVL